MPLATLPFVPQSFKNPYLYITLSLFLGIIFLFSPWISIPGSGGTYASFTFWKITSTIHATDKCISLANYENQWLSVLRFAGWFIFALQVNIWIVFWLTNYTENSDDNRLAKRFTVFLLIVAIGFFVLVSAEQDCSFQSITNISKLPAITTRITLSWPSVLVSVISIFLGIFAFNISSDVKNQAVQS